MNDGARAAERHDGCGGGASTERRNCKSGGVTRLLLVVEPRRRGGTARAVERHSCCRRWSLGQETELLERWRDTAAAAAVGAEARPLLLDGCWPGCTEARNPRRPRGETACMCGGVTRLLVEVEPRPRGETAGF